MQAPDTYEPAPLADDLAAPELDSGIAAAAHDPSNAHDDVTAQAWPGFYSF